MLHGAVKAGWQVVVVADWDNRGRGAAGARRLATTLAKAWDVTVRVIEPSDHFKDPRSWLGHRHINLENEAERTKAQLDFLTFACPRDIAFPEGRPTLDPETRPAFDAAAATPLLGNQPSPAEERCTRPRYKMFIDNKDGHFEDWFLRCGAAICPGCLLRRKRLRRESLEEHFGRAYANGKQLSTVTIDPRDWPKLSRAISRQGGQQSVRICRRGALVVITTAVLGGGRVLTLDEAKVLLAEAIRDAEPGGKKRPFCTASRDWAMIREKKPSYFSCLGSMAVTPQKFARMCHDRQIERGVYLPLGGEILQRGQLEIITNPVKQMELLRDSLIPNSGAWGDGGYDTTESTPIRQDSDMPTAGLEQFDEAFGDWMPLTG
jgi:hypothetical protein